MACWVDQNTPQNARIASVETGAVGWYCNRYLIDIVGLTTPQNARYTAKRDFSSWLEEKPDYIVVHPANTFPWEEVALLPPNGNPLRQCLSSREVESVSKLILEPDRRGFCGVTVGR